MKYHIASLGTFITKGTLVVTDPCYTDSGQWLKLQVSGAVWKTSAIVVDSGFFGIRVAELFAWEGTEEPTSFGRRVGGVGVDSGQVGIFDSQLKIGFGDSDEAETFYGTCCDITLNRHEQSGTVFGRGVVSSSGFGDGFYPVYARVKKGRVSAIRVCYIQDVLKVIKTSLDELPLLIGKFYDDSIAAEVLNDRIRRQE